MQSKNLKKDVSVKLSENSDNKDKRLDKDKVEDTKENNIATEEESIIPVIVSEEDTEGIKVIESKFDTSAWKPRTGLGKRVKNGEVTDIRQIFDQGLKILEPEITDVMVPNLETELLFIGQAKGKFGGGQKRIFKQTQKKTKEGNKPHFTIVAAIGNKDGIIGIGYGKSKETVPAREKAIRNAKLNIMNIKRGCGSWQCNCANPHSIPIKIEGKCGSVIIRLMPAPKGTGLKVGKETQKILRLGGISDVWSKTIGSPKSKINLVYACRDALKEISEMKFKKKDIDALRIKEGSVKGLEPFLEEDKNGEK